MTVELSHPTLTLMSEILEHKLPPEEIAKTYQLAMQSSVQTDWAKVNQAIRSRFGKTGLNSIKNRAQEMELATR